MIKAHNLCKNFKSTKALKSLNFKLQKGKIVALIGHDGAGKTTLLRLLCSLLTPSFGEIEIANFKLPSSSNKLLDLIGYMPQNFGLYENLTCMENLNLYASLQDIQDKNRINELLDFTNLTPFKDRFAKNLSGGMKQKLSLCATLLKKPKILLLDEPGVGVDPIARDEIFEMVKGLLDDESLIVWATSYLDEAELFDEVLLLNEGEILYNDTPKKAMQKLENRVFLAHSNNKKETLEKLLSQKEALDAYIKGSKIKLTLRKNASNFIHSFEQIDFYKTKPSFEDAYLDMLDIKTKSTSKLSNILDPIIGDEVSIEAIGLTKKFGNFTAAQDISFKVKKGEIFGLIGPNGAGKSTTFRMLCALLKPSFGQTLILGKSLKKNPKELKNKIGYMAQKFSLYSNLKLIDNLEFFAGIYGLNGKAKREKIATMIEIFGFGEYLKSIVEELSLGIKQRLALACSLMHSPSVLFLDEPTSGVDPLTRKEFWTHIRALVGKKVSVMVTTHLMEEAELCDKIMLIDRGKAIACGTPDSLKEQISKEATMQEAFVHLVKQQDMNQKKATR